VPEAGSTEFRRRAAERLVPRARRDAAEELRGIVERGAVRRGRQKLRHMAQVVAERDRVGRDRALGHGPRPLRPRLGRQMGEHGRLEGRERGEGLGQEVVRPGRERRGPVRVVPRDGEEDRHPRLRAREIAQEREPRAVGQPDVHHHDRGAVDRRCRAAERSESARRMRAPERRQRSRIASQAKRLSSTTRTVWPRSGRSAVGRRFQIRSAMGSDMAAPPGIDAFE
jgi:hypothetical protein